MDDEYEYPEDVVVAYVHPNRPGEATHILERWADFQYVEVGRAHSEEEAIRKAQEIADMKEIDIRVRLKNSLD